MADGKPGRPATGQVQSRSVRMGATWDEAHQAAKDNGEKFAVFLERAIRRELDRLARNKARTQGTPQ